MNEQERNGKTTINQQPLQNIGIYSVMILLNYIVFALQHVKFTQHIGNTILEEMSAMTSLLYPRLVFQVSCKIITGILWRLVLFVCLLFHV